MFQPQPTVCGLQAYHLSGKIFCTLAFFANVHGLEAASDSLNKILRFGYTVVLTRNRRL